DQPRRQTVSRCNCEPHGAFSCGWPQHGAAQPCKSLAHGMRGDFEYFWAFFRGYGGRGPSRLTVAGPTPQEFGVLRCAARTLHGLRELPAEDGSAPGETGTKAGEEQMVAAMKAVGGEDFAQGEWNAAGGGVAVTVEIDDELFGRDAEVFGGSIEDA